MDRLSALIILVAVAGCSDKKSGEPAGRTNSAKTAPKQGGTTKAFCDFHAPAGAGPLFTWPNLGNSTPPTSTGETWRWVNVWATWCQPCIEELPRIAKWRDKLATPQRPLEVTFLSADESQADIDDVKKTTPLPETYLLAQPDKVNDWLHTFGMQGEPPIPVHVFVDPKNRVRCIRAAAVRDSDYDAVAKLLAE